MDPRKWYVMPDGDVLAVIQNRVMGMHADGRTVPIGANVLDVEHEGRQVSQQQAIAAHHAFSGRQKRG